MPKANPFRVGAAAPRTPAAPTPAQPPAPAVVPSTPAVVTPGSPTPAQPPSPAVPNRIMQPGRSLVETTRPYVGYSGGVAIHTGTRFHVPTSEARAMGSDVSIIEDEEPTRDLDAEFAAMDAEEAANA